MTILYPQMRQEVMLAIASLVQSESEGAWSVDDIPRGYDYVVHVLYDDMGCFPEPRRALGALYFDGDELEKVERLSKLLTDVIDDHDFGSLRSVRLDPRWRAVIYASGLALSAMVINDFGKHA